MFDRDVNYPTAVASYDTIGVRDAISWCTGHMEKGDTLTVWTSLKSNLRNSKTLEQYVKQHSDVEHVTGRGGAFLSGPGPVLMAWGDMDDIGELVRNGGSYIRALCVIAWNEGRLRPWVTAVRPQVLGDGSAWEDLAPAPTAIVVEALKSMTLIINHNNTISAGFEKDQVVSLLLALKDARIPMDSEAMQGWALANGWSGKNPARLAKYVDDINAGKRPQCSRVLRSDYIDTLRRRAAGQDDDE